MSGCQVEHGETLMLASEKAFASLRLILGRYYFEAFQKPPQKSIFNCQPELVEGYSVLKQGFDRLNLAWSCIFGMASSRAGKARNSTHHLCSDAPRG